ncbi:MAG: hypothetical protein KGQ77_11250 [Betaproteobacteria bacterium]|nr:hypothetical protein [Betaproteobacteria bacterium]
MSAQWVLLILMSVMLALLGAALVQLVATRALTRLQARDRALEDSVLGMESATPYLMRDDDMGQDTVHA